MTVRAGTTPADAEATPRYDAAEMARRGRLGGRIGGLRVQAQYGPQTIARRARAGVLPSFERQVDPAGALPPAERRQRAELAYRAHMRTLAQRRHATRRSEETPSPKGAAAMSVSTEPRTAACPECRQQLPLDTIEALDVLSGRFAYSPRDLARHLTHGLQRHPTRGDAGQVTDALATWLGVEDLTSLVAAARHRATCDR